jgi:hypothetical protein
VSNQRIETEIGPVFVAVMTRVLRLRRPIADLVLQTRWGSACPVSCGVAKSAHQEQNRTALDQFLLPLDIAVFDEQAANCYGTVRAELQSRGASIGPLDTGLRLEDWL